ncbi:hypothetical protein ACU5EH_04270 [Aliivibrio salmonicida]|uniref:hypothetical protein n=1 Tax=Aliivibrio salmonicida TaxID=40269 RepID=UPI00406CE96B
MKAIVAIIIITSLLGCSSVTPKDPKEWAASNLIFYTKNDPFIEDGKFANFFSWGQRYSGYSLQMEQCKFSNRQRGEMDNLHKKLSLALGKSGYKQFWQGYKTSQDMTLSIKKDALNHSFALYQELFGDLNKEQCLQVKAHGYLMLHDGILEVYQWATLTDAHESLSKVELDYIDNLVKAQPSMPYGKEYQKAIENNISNFHDEVKILK